MDLSAGSDIDLIRQRIIDEVSVPVGTVPLYQVCESSVWSAFQFLFLPERREHRRDAGFRQRYRNYATTRGRFLPKFGKIHQNFSHPTAEMSI